MSFLDGHLANDRGIWAVIEDHLEQTKMPSNIGPPAVALDGALLVHFFPSTRRDVVKRSTLRVDIEKIRLLR